MKTVIIYAHPWDGSFNHHVLTKTIDKLEAKGDQVDVIDLNKDEFDPVMHAADLRLFASGKYHDKKAEDYAERLKAADRAIFIFPIWWYGMPAILKGFLDKVLLKGTTYVEDENKNLRGVLDIKESAIFTTGNIDEGFFEQIGDPIKNTLITGTLRMVGIENTKWFHCPTVHLEAARDSFLKKIDNYLE